MTKDQAFKFQQRWRQLEQERTSLDFRRSQFAKDLRGEFGTGESGDGAFRKWCLDHLGLAESKAEELLARAQAAAILPDEQSFKRVGGFPAVRHLIGMPKREQVTIIEVAKAQNKHILTVKRERGGVVPEKDRPASYAEDARALANYIARELPVENIPGEVLRVVRRYVAVTKRVAA